MTTLGIDGMRALVLALFPTLTWRHHGIGVLQAYVAEGREPEVRVHVWHPRLVREGIVGQGDAHDHRFDLESTVIVGKLFEDLYSPDPENARRFDVWHVENARSAGADRGFDGDCHPIESDVGMTLTMRVHPTGANYALGRSRFHRTWVDALAITVCTMREKRGQARLLVPARTEPVHAFGAHDQERAAAAAVQVEVLVEAMRALRGGS